MYQKQNVVFQVYIKLKHKLSCMTAHVQLFIAVSVNKNGKIMTLGIQFWVAANADVAKRFFHSFTFTDSNGLFS